MGPGIGGSAAPTTPPHGMLWVDVRDYGAKADGGVTDNSVPFQAAIDDLATKLAIEGNKGGTVFIPGSPRTYVVNNSIWVDSNNIEIRGETGTFIQMQGTPQH